MIEREAVRAIVMAPSGAVLLMQIRDPAAGRTTWICPGGGLDAGEAPRDGLLRELTEELGHEAVRQIVLGPPVYRWRHTFWWSGVRYRQTETFYAVTCPSIEPRMSDPHEAAYTVAFRWWTVAEMQSTDETISPRALAEVLLAYAREGAPRELSVEEVDSS